MDTLLVSTWLINFRAALAHLSQHLQTVFSERHPILNLFKIHETNAACSRLIAAKH